MDRYNEWMIRFAYASLSVTVALGAWLLFNVESKLSMSIGAVVCVFCFLGHEMYKDFVPDVQAPVSNEQRIRVRVAELEKRTEPDREELIKLREELAELEQKKTYRG